MGYVVGKNFDEKDTLVLIRCSQLPFIAGVFQYEEPKKYVTSFDKDEVPKYDENEVFGNSQLFDVKGNEFSWIEVYEDWTARREELILKHLSEAFVNVIHYNIEITLKSNGFDRSEIITASSKIFTNDFLASCKVEVVLAHKSMSPFAKINFDPLNHKWGYWVPVD